MSIRQSLLAVSLLATVSLHAEKKCIDKIKAIVFTDEIAVITQSDEERPSLDGSPRSLKDIKMEQQIYQDALTYNPMANNSESVDKYIASIQREHNLTHEQVEAMFSGAGYTFEEGKKQLGIMQTVNSMLDFKIRSRLIVPEREILKYYQDHQDEAIIPASYYLAHTTVAYTDNKEEQKKKLTLFSQGKGAYHDITWSEPFWINANDLAEDKKFIMDLGINQISLPTATEEGFELFRLEDKKEAQKRELDENYRNEIANILRQPRFTQLFEAYQKELDEKIAVVYL